MGYNPTKTWTPRLGQITTKISKGVFRKHGPVLGQIFLDWEKIVGPHVAALAQVRDMTFPFKQKTGGTLHLAVTPGSAPIVQHLEQTIVERANSFFGYKALTRVRLIHGSFSTTPTGPLTEPEIVLEASDQAWLEDMMEGVDSEDLKESLRKMGTSLLKARS